VSVRIILVVGVFEGWRDLASVVRERVTFFPDPGIDGDQLASCLLLVSL
jgi:hypothetical protein